MVVVLSAEITGTATAMVGGILVGAITGSGVRTRLGRMSPVTGAGPMGPKSSWLDYGNNITYHGDYVSTTAINRQNQQLPITIRAPDFWRYRLPPLHQYLESRLVPPRYR